VFIEYVLYIIDYIRFDLFGDREKEEQSKKVLLDKCGGVYFVFVSSKFYILSIAADSGDDFGAYAVCQRSSSARQHDFSAEIQPRLPPVLHHTRLRVQRIHDTHTVSVIIMPPISKYRTNSRFMAETWSVKLAIFCEKCSLQ